jgi:hypothetical protein
LRGLKAPAMAGAFLCFLRVVLENVVFLGGVFVVN